MTYQGYLISNFATGLDKEVQPWLLPDDAQFELLDGYVYRGVWQKREGYSQFATGQRAGAAYCESRMVHRITAEVIGTGDGLQTVFTATLSDSPVRRGTVSVAYTIGGVDYVATDNGVGIISGTDVDSSGTNSTIDYTTGDIQITFTIAPDNLADVDVTYDAHQGFPVMGVMNYFTQTNVKELIVADTTYVNRYNSSTNRLDDISPTTLLTGDKTNFFSWTDYPDSNANQRLLFVNFKDPVQQYDGSTVTTYPIYTASTVVTTTASGTLGDGGPGPYTITLASNLGILPGTLTITGDGQTVTDDSRGNLTGQGTGTVDYLHGIIVVTFSGNVTNGMSIDIAYTQLNTPIDTALHIFQFKDRLVVLYTIESGIQYGHRIRVSGTGVYCDVFTSDAIGAGVIDIPSNSFISSADFNRDDLIIFPQYETWIMKYTQNEAVPFALNRIDSSRGSQAPYGSITYLNRTDAKSTVGFIVTDGYSVERSDLKLPDYSYNEIDQDNFKLCYAGTVDIDRDHYLIHPASGSDKSDRILVTNYEEDNFSVYRIPLSCMGTFNNAFSVTWNDLSVFDTWDQLSMVFKNWNSFSYVKGAPVSIGGGHEGQIFRLNDSENQDYPVRVRNLTVVDINTLEVTTDFQNYVVGDFITLVSVIGMYDVNSQQYAIKEIVSPYVFRLEVPNTNNFGTYISGGWASKCIIFDCKTKKFNPFANTDKKVACGWVYFYVSTSGTDLTMNRPITLATQTNPCVLTVFNHNYKTGDQIYINSVGGMTELNGNYYTVTVLTSNTFSLNDTDATGYTAYTSGGFCAIRQNAILDVRCITNDTEESTAVYPYNPSPYQVNLTNSAAENGIKKWYKMWINQTARFIQFELVNNQAGASIQIHAIMPGFMPTGRLV